MKIHWYDDKDTQIMLVRSQVFFVKRTGISRFVNLFTHVLLMPFYIVSLLVLVISLPILLYNQLRLIRMNRIINDRELNEITKKYLVKEFQCKNITSSLASFLSRLTKYSPHSIMIKLVNRMKSTNFCRALYDNRQVILYLRPFRMDTRKAMTVPFSDEVMDLEYIITNFANGIGPVVSLGADAISKTKATRLNANNENWRYKVSELLKQSRYVVIVPEDTDGTLWEINRILENKDYLDKTIFLNINSAGRYHPVWEKARNIYCEDDGETFKNTLNRIIGRLNHDFPPIDQIVCAFVVNDELNLICSSKILEAALWGASPKFAIYLKEKLKST